MPSSLPAPGSELPSPRPPQGPKPAQNGCHPSEAAILGAQTVASLGMGLYLHGNFRPPAPSSLHGGGHRNGSLPGLAKVPTIRLSLPEIQRGPGPSLTPFPQCQGEEQMASLGVLLLPSPSFHFWLFLSLCHCISASLSVHRGACMSLYVLACSCVCGHVCIAPLSSRCLRRAHPTPPSVPIFRAS